MSCRKSLDEIQAEGSSYNFTEKVLGRAPKKAIQHSPYLSKASNLKIFLGNHKKSVLFRRPPSPGRQHTPPQLTKPTTRHATILAFLVEGDKRGRSYRAFPVLAQEWNQHTASTPLASLGDESGLYPEGTTEATHSIIRRRAVMVDENRVVAAVGEKRTSELTDIGRGL